MRRFALAILAVGLAACNASKPSPEAAADAQPAEPEKASVRHALFIDDLSQLPACTPDAEHWLIYVKSEATLKTCSGGQWSDVDLRGEKGDKGERGDNGSTTEVPPNSPLPSRIVVDAENKVIGRLLDEEKLAVRVDGTKLVVRLSSLESGFSKLSDFDRCVFFEENCQGGCYVQGGRRISLGSEVKLFIPDLNVVKKTNGWPAQLSDSFSCDQDATPYFTPEKKIIEFHPTAERAFTLPFRFLE